MRGGNMIRSMDGTREVATITIDEAERLVQAIRLPRMQRCEGIAFSSSGNILAVATAESNGILMFRKTADGSFEDTPFWTLEGSRSGLRYPHDLSFAQCGDTELLAVAQR